MLSQVTEQEYIARMQMYFQEQILYAHELAQQERQRSNELMSQVRPSYFPPPRSVTTVTPILPGTDLADAGTQDAAG